VSGPPDGPPLDPRRLLGTLNRHHVDYLVVGGIAAQAHGASSTTHDIDCVPRDGLENAERLAGALRQLHARPFIPGIPDEHAQQLTFRLDGLQLLGSQVSRWMTDAGPIDVLHDIPLRDGDYHGYDELIRRGEPRRFHGITIHVAALDDIIASKERANRPKDRDALPELRRLLDRQQHRSVERPEPPEPPLPGLDL
jgi:hypothetical protein